MNNKKRLCHSEGVKRPKNLFDFKDSSLSLRMTKKSAFTLAEVLITLSILGVVAAISIPSVIQQYQTRITVTKIKKYYAVLQNAFEIYKITHSPTELPKNHKEVFDEFIRPYFKITYDAGTPQRNQEKILKSVKYLYLNDQEWATLTGNDWYAVKIVDGSVFVIRYYGGMGKSEQYGNFAFIYVDINGEKGPNQMGKDFFQFVINAKNSQLEYLLPYGIVNLTTGGNINDFKMAAEGCKYIYSGSGCAAWIIAKGNMDYLKSNCNKYIDLNTLECKSTYP